MVLSLSLMDQGLIPNHNITQSGFPVKFWGLFGEVAHIAEKNYVIGQFAKTKFLLFETSMVISQSI